MVVLFLIPASHFLDNEKFVVGFIDYILDITVQIKMQLLIGLMI